MSVMQGACGEALYSQGMYCMVATPFGQDSHSGDHKAWSTNEAEDEDQPWVIRWPNKPRNLRLWRTLNCRAAS